MTIDLDELERIGQAATDAEWGVRGDMVSSPPPNEALRRICLTMNDTYLTEMECAANAKFIAAARNNWQAMIDELRRLQADSKRWRWCESHVALARNIFGMIDYEGGDVAEEVDQQINPHKQ